MPGDTLNMGITLGQAVARQADIDLGRGIYRVGSLSWHEGRLTYDDRYQPEVKGLDYNHIDMSHLALDIDSISYSPEGTSLLIRHAAMKECRLFVKKDEILLAGLTLYITLCIKDESRLCEGGP